MSDNATAVLTAGERWTLTGPLTMESAAGVLASSADLALPGAGIVDLAGVDGVDSAAVAVLLAWKRRAVTDGKPLVFTNLPASLISLASLYGVDDLLAR